MLETVKIETRGPVGRNFLPLFRAASKRAWNETGKEFASNHIDKRFTAAWGREANYSPRSGQNLPPGTKGFFNTYFGRKIRQFGHGDPFVWSGETRRNARAVFVSSSGNGATVRLPAATRINYHPKLALEFRRIIPREATELGQFYDRQLNTHLQNVQNAT